MKTAIEYAERGLFPDPLIRYGIRQLLKARISEVEERAGGDTEASERAFRDSLREAPIAVETDAANEQHYELPPSFFEQVLGPHLKYSGCFWTERCRTLGDAEEEMLTLTCERAAIEDGDRILELGCGWGSLTLFMAQRFPRSSIVAVSNSTPQRRFIEGRLAALGLDNVEVITTNVAELEPPGTFNRVVSVEMFEHMRNPGALLARLETCLEPRGTVFIHVFSHQQHSYLFETEAEDDWMGKYFFTGGMMPSDNLLPSLQGNLELRAQWRVNGEHYARTAEAWLQNLRRRRKAVLPILVDAYGNKEARLWFNRWRIFFLSCAELFRYRGGDEWAVSHYLFERP